MKTEFLSEFFLTGIKPFLVNYVQQLLRALFIAFVVAPFCFWSQTDSLKQKKLDSLRTKLYADSAHIYRFKNVRPYLSIDNRNTYINGKPAHFGGLQFGLILREVHTLGLGIYGITQSSKRPYFVLDDTIPATLSISLNYITFFYEYNFLERKHFEMSLPLEIGLGGYDIRWENSTTHQIYRERKGGIIPIGIGLQPMWKPIPWVGLSFLFGYRTVLGNNTRENFNGFYYNIGLTFDLRQIYRDIKFRGFVRKKYRRQAAKIVNN